MIGRKKGCKIFHIKLTFSMIFNFNLYRLQHFLGKFARDYILCKILRVIQILLGDHLTFRSQI